MTRGTPSGLDAVVVWAWASRPAFIMGLMALFEVPSNIILGKKVGALRHRIAGGIMINWGNQSRARDRPFCGPGT